MNKEKLKKMGNNPKYIEGIYNYCDRWCEWCILSSRCLNYAIEKEDDTDLNAKDINNKAYWKRIESYFKLAIELLHDYAKENNIDLNNINHEKLDAKDKKDTELIKNHPAAKKAHKYISIVNDWMDNEYQSFQEKEEELNLKLSFDENNTEPHNEADDITNIIDTIRWYQHFIYVKLTRALSYRKEMDKFAEENNFPKDSDGSAKISTIAIEKSIGAWNKLGQYFPEKLDSILDILLHLDRLKRMIKNEFPKAESFIRPGFDEINKL